MFVSSSLPTLALLGAVRSRTHALCPFEVKARTRYIALEYALCPTAAKHVALGTSGQVAGGTSRSREAGISAQKGRLPEEYPESAYGWGNNLVRSLRPVTSSSFSLRFLRDPAYQTSIPLERAHPLFPSHLDAVPHVLVLQLDKRSPQLHSLPKIFHDLLAHLLAPPAWRRRRQKRTRSQLFIDKGASLSLSLSLSLSCMGMISV